MQSQGGRAPSKLRSPLTLLESIQVHTTELPSLGHSDRSVCFFPKLPDFETSGEAFSLLIQDDKISQFLYTLFIFKQEVTKPSTISCKCYIKN